MIYALCIANSLEPLFQFIFSSEREIIYSFCHFVLCKVKEMDGKVIFSTKTKDRNPNRKSKNFKLNSSKSQIFEPNKTISSDDEIPTTSKRSRSQQIKPDPSFDESEFCDLNSTVSEKELNVSKKSTGFDEIIKNSIDSQLFDKYFHIVQAPKEKNENFVTVCKLCKNMKPTDVTVRGSLQATSNFIRHLKVT